MFRPRRYASDVASELVNGLQDGSILLFGPQDAEVRDLLLVEAEIGTSPFTGSTAYRRGLEIAIRIRDVVFSTVALLVLSPILVLCALLIKATSPGPILYRSQRMGKGGRHYTFLKFRTMYVDSESRLLTLNYADYAPVFKITRDPRITWVGRLLRRYSLDHLPQLLNVLRGDIMC